jgi:hypothetical protein
MDSKTMNTTTVLALIMYQCPFSSTMHGLLEIALRIDNLIHSSIRAYNNKFYASNYLLNIILPS